MTNIIVPTKETNDTPILLYKGKVFRLSLIDRDKFIKPGAKQIDYCREYPLSYFPKDQCEEVICYEYNAIDFDGKSLAYNEIEPVDAKSIITAINGGNPYTERDCLLDSLQNPETP